MKEIEACRPFFVCLLGSRYGWVPPPEEIEQAFYESISDIPDDIAYWYMLDETTVPPVYRLRRDEKMPDGMPDEIARFCRTILHKPTVRLLATVLFRFQSGPISVNPSGK